MHVTVRYVSTEGVRGDQCCRMASEPEDVEDATVFFIYIWNVMEEEIHVAHVQQLCDVWESEG